MAVYDWIAGRPVVGDDTVYDWSTGRPRVVYEHTGGPPPAGWSHDLNGVANANIAEVNGILIASIAEINGVA